MTMKTYRIPCPGCEEPLTLLVLKGKLYVGELSPLENFSTKEKPNAGARLRAVTRHAKKMAKEPHPCKKCGRVFFSQQGLGGHMNYHNKRGKGKE